MPYGVVAGVAALGGAALSANASRSAARTQGRAADAASQVQRDIFNTVNTQQQPFINTGYGANDVLARLLGVNVQRGGAFDRSGNSGPISQFDDTNGQLVGDTYLPQGTTTKQIGKGRYDVFFGDKRIGKLVPGGSNGRYIQESPIPQEAYKQINPGLQSAPDGQGSDTQGMPGPGGYRPDNTGLDTGYLTQTFGPQQFLEGMDPGYRFRLQQGAQGVMNSAAGRTGALSGPALKALMDYNQGAASQEFGSAFDRFQTQQGNIFQRLLSLTSLGQGAAAGVGQQGITTGGQIGANIIGAGNAAAAGQVGAANAYSGAFGDLAGLALAKKFGAM